MSDCRKCTRFEECAVDEDCGLFVAKPMTNYDLLIFKPPEELAGWLCQTQYRDGDFCPPKHEWQYCIMAGGCRECWLSWLNAPADKEWANGN